MRELYLDKAYRNQGLGTQLMKKGNAFFKKKGLKFALITVDKDNPRAERVYRKSGFKDFRHLLLKEIKWKF